jgi:transposase
METLTLTFRQRRHLERQLRCTHDARLYRRTLAILEVASGEPVAAVALRLRVTPRSVYKWVAAYGHDHDPAALAEVDKPGRPTLLGPTERDLLRRLLASSPQDFGYPAATWTVPLLRRHLVEYANVLLSEDTLRREVRRLRYSWKRPRYRLDPDPELRGKKDAYPQGHQRVATPHRRTGAGRNRPAAVPAAAVLLVACGASQGGCVVRS